MREYIVHEPKDNPCAIEQYTSFYGEPIKELVRCMDCTKWKRNDGAFPDFDGKEWHGCKELESFTSKIWNETEPATPSWFYCGYAERKEE